MKIKTKKALKQVKVKRKFIWWPMELNGEWRWLCFATIKYRMEQVIRGNKMVYKWIALEWAKKERPHNKRTAAAGALNKR